LDKSISLKNQLNISGITNYQTNSNTLTNFIFSQIYLLNNKVKNEITVENWNTKKDEVRERLSYCLGLNNLPPKSDLNAKSVGIIERNDYFIEKVIFETFDAIFVPSHLYIPKNISSPAPAILHIPGHWLENSKMESDIQKCCINLTKHGFIVLNIDQMDQGERRNNWKVHGHIESLLVGITQLGMMIYENIKAIDYLESREEVNKDKIGMMGTSGGGSNTAYTSALDSRIKAAAIICYAVTYPGLLEGQRYNNFDSGYDLCDQIPFVLNSLTFAHLLALTAPQPVLIISAEKDLHFPLDSAKELFREAKPYFDLYDHNLIKHIIVPGPHGQGKEARENAYGFFLKWLMDKGDDSPVKEPRTEIETLPYRVNYMEATAEKDRAQTFVPEKGLPTYVFEDEELREIKVPLKRMFLEAANKKYRKPNTPETLEDWGTIKINQREILNRMMVKTIDHSFLNPRIVSTTESPGYYVERIMIDSEEGITLPCLLFLPDEWNVPNNVWICIDDNGKNGFIDNPIFSHLVNSRQAIFTLDLRGQGEMLASEFEVSTMCYMLDRNLMSMRIFDLLRSLEYISQRASTSIQLNKQKITCYGKGSTALVTLFAGALDERIVGIFIENIFTSYKYLLDSDLRVPPIVYIYDILSSFDIDNLLSLVFPRPLIILNPTNNKRESSSESIKKEFKFTIELYEKFSQEENLIIQHSKKDIYPELIEKILNQL